MNKKLHLGCGDRIFPGWDNLDIQNKKDVIQCDLTKPLPYETGSITQIYSEHFIEHISYQNGLNLIKECFRVLSKGGDVFFVTPDLDELLSCYNTHNTLRYRETGWLPQSRCRMLNEGMHEWGHQFVYNEEELIRSFVIAGFRNIERLDRAKNVLPIQRPDCSEIIIKAWK